MSVFAVGPMRVTKKPAANLPQTATLDLFGVAGTVRAIIFSRVTTTLGASGGSTTKYLYTPTVGATATDLSAAADLGTAAAPLFVYPWIVASTVTTLSIGGGVAASSTNFCPLVMPQGFWVAAGTFQLNCTGNQTGQLEHWCLWIPMAPDSYVYSL